MMCEAEVKSPPERTNLLKINDNKHMEHLKILPTELHRLCEGGEFDRNSGGGFVDVWRGVLLCIAPVMKLQLESESHPGTPGIPKAFRNLLAPGSHCRSRQG